MLRKIARYLPSVFVAGLYVINPAEVNALPTRLSNKRFDSSNRFINSNLNVTECPPANAFTYDNQWNLDSTYQSQWVMLASPNNNAPSNNTLYPLSELFVALASENTDFLAMCLYSNGNVQIDLESNGTLAKPEPNENFHLVHEGNDYECITSAASNKVCRW